MLPLRRYVRRCSEHIISTIAPGTPANCPVTLIERGHGGYVLPPYALGHIDKFRSVMESKKFKKQLRNLGSRIQNDWGKKKDALQVCLPRYPEFQKFSEKNCWSLRLVDGHRVHLDKIGDNFREWVALEVGSHRAMGHG